MGRTERDGTEIATLLSGMGVAEVYLKERAKVYQYR
jgi:hypothetical protein